MLFNTLMNNVKVIHQKTNLPDDRIEDILRFISRFDSKNNKWIYPSTIKRQMRISLKDSYCLLDELRKFGFLERYYELTCMNCGKDIDGLYRTFNELPETYYCEGCTQEYTAIDNASIVFKVIRDE